MNKSVLWGGGLGLLLLAFLAGIWVAGARPGSTARDEAPVAAGAPSAVVGSESSVGSRGTVSSSPGATPSPPSATGSAQPNQAPWLKGADSGATGSEKEAAVVRQERREARAKIRALSAQLQAKGAAVTNEDVNRFLDEVSRLDGVDPRYIKTLREVFSQNLRAQALSKELSKLSQATSGPDATRRLAILAELRDISDRINNGMVAMQQHGQDAVQGTKR